LTYEVECESEWKFPIVLPDVNTLWDKFSVKKRRVSMQILTHETMTVCAVSNTISHSFIQRDVSLQNCINCDTWRRASFHSIGTLGEDVRYQNVTLWVPNIGTITSFREGFGGKSPLSFLRSFATTHLQSYCLRSVTGPNRWRPKLTEHTQSTAMRPGGRADPKPTDPDPQRLKFVW